MKPPLFSMDQSQFYYPGQDIIIEGSQSYIVSSEEYKNLETAKNWILLIAAIFTFVFIVISARLFEYTVLKENPVSARVSKDLSTPIGFSMKRADITDRNGTILATNMPIVNLYSDNSLLNEDDIEEVAKKLTATLPSLDYQTVKNRLSQKKRFVYLKHRLIPAEHQAVHDLGYPALQFEETEKRVYPQGNLFSHILGSVGFENKGLAGVEKAFDELLLSTKEPLKLALDVGVQHSVRETLAKYIEHFKAKGGTALVMDVNNSEIISMVSLPDFDPNLPPKANDTRMFNRATLGVYEFGSVFKIFNTAIALESGAINFEDKIDSSPLVLTKYKTIKDLHPLNRKLSLTEVMVHSSNTASARMALEIGYERQQEYFSRLGFFDDTKIELPEKTSPVLPKYWRADATVASLSYGYGMSVTPLHVINAVGAIVNGGLYRPASLLSPNPHLKEVGTRVLSKKNSEIMRQMLRAVVTDGTGRNSDVAGYDVGGKTGTAEKISKGAFDEDNIRASFVAVFPTSEPKYAVLVMMDEPQALPETYGFKTAGWNATKCTKEIIEAIAPKLNVLPNFSKQEKTNIYQKVGLEVK